MYVVRSPRGTYLIDEGLRDDRFAVWSYRRGKAMVFTQAEYDALRRIWPYLAFCELEPAIEGGIRVAS